MKKIICLLMCSVIILSGCAKKDESDKSTTTTTADKTTLVNSTDSTKSTTTKKTTSKTTTSKKTSTTTKKKTTTNCSKVFKNKYSVVSKDKATCMKEGNLKFLDLSDAGEDVFAYSCEEIKDACGDTYFGAFYWRYDHDKSTEVKVYR